MTLSALARRASMGLLALGLLVAPLACGGGGGGSTPAPAQPTAPVISTQPAAQTVVEGASASFTVAATGNGTLSYQWQKGGVDLAGKTSATLSINPVALTDAGSYAVKVTNTLNGSSLVTTSAAATLTVNAAATSPAITTQPVGQTVLEGGSASFTVAATGNGTLSYQWQKGGVDLVGKTSATLSISPVALGDAGSYAVKVTNSLNGTTATTTSDAATLTVNAVASVPVLTTQPAAQTVLQGGSASFTVAATGNGTLTYQWQKGGVDLAGKTSATLSLDPVALADAGDYTAVVTNSLNGTTATATSSAATLTVTPQTATHLVVAGYPSPTVAGVSHAFTVTALDALDHVVSGFTGTVQITSDDPQAVLPAATAFTAGDAGVHTFSASFRTAGTRSLTATQTTNSAVTGSQTGITVTPAATAMMVVAGYPTSTTTGQANTLYVRPFDVYGNQASGYTGTVHFTSTDVAAVLPADYTFQASDAGNHNFSVTLNTAGTQSITATDTVNATLTGTQAGIVVGAASLAIQTQPQGQTVIAPDGATFTVSATGTGTLTYQWRKNGTDISGATGASYSVSATDLQETSALYSVVVGNGTATLTSENATLTVMAPEPTYAGDPTAVPVRPLTVVPSYTVGAAFPHGSFRVGYDEALKNPVWTAYGNFKFQTAFANSSSRPFAADDRLAAPQVTDSDYSGSGWTRGHQVMMSDLAYRYGTQAGLDSCRLSNVAPEDADHNNNFWNRLEQRVGGSFTGSGGAWVPGLADTFSRIWIYTGPTFEADAALLPGAVAPVKIPSGFWKVVVREAAPGDPKVLAILTPNTSGLATSDAEVQKYTTSVARIEALTGLDLFPSPSSPLPATFKTAVDVRGWGGAFEVTGKPNVHMVAPSWDTTTTAGTTLTFQGDATSTGSTIASTSWTFGDGATASGTSTTHTYATGGTFTVTFTATDSLGASNAITRVITVTGGNQAPTVTGLPTSETTPADTAKDIPFSVSDDVAPLAVTFSASSSDQAIVPDSGLTFTGTLASPVLHVVPATGATGTVTLTVRVTDGDLATTTKTLTLSVGTAAPPTPLFENFTWAGTGTTYATGDFTLATGSWHFVTTLSVSTDASDAKNDGQGVRLQRNVTGSAIWMNFDFGDASSQASSVSVAYGVYLSDQTNARTATFSLYASQDQGATWTQVGSSVTASSNTLSTATFSGLNLTGPVRFKLAVEGVPTARLCLDDFRIQ